jgi:replicative DNA helicase
MAKKKYKGKSKASIEADKKKSLSDIEKTRRKLQAIDGRELESKRLSAKDMIELNKAIYDLNKNKLLIEDTPRGTPSQKPSTWSRKSRQNRSKFG